MNEDLKRALSSFESGGDRVDSSSEDSAVTAAGGDADATSIEWRNVLRGVGVLSGRLGEIIFGAGLLAVVSVGCFYVLGSVAGSNSELQRMEARGRFEREEMEQFSERVLDDVQHAVPKGPGVVKEPEEMALEGKVLLPDRSDYKHLGRGLIASQDDKRVTVFVLERTRAVKVGTYVLKSGGHDLRIDAMDTSWEAHVIYWPEGMYVGTLAYDVPAPKEVELGLTHGGVICGDHLTPLVDLIYRMPRE